MVAAVAQVTLSVSSLLALQRLTGVTMLPAHLRIRPQLLRMADRDLPVSAEERQVLSDAGLLDGNVVDPDAVTMLRALVSPDAEITMTLAAPGLDDTYVSLIRRSELVVAAIRCDDSVTIDAYMNFHERDVVAVLASTIRSYLFGPDSQGVAARIPATRFPADAAVAAMSTAGVFEGSMTFYEALKPHGVPELVADALYRAEKNPLGRAQVCAYIAHEGTRSSSEIIVQVTNTSTGALMTSCSLDNNLQRWITAEPYDDDELERRISAAIRSVPASSWFTHCRTD